MSRGAGKKGGQAKGDAGAAVDEKDQWVAYLEKELREQQKAMSQAGARTLDERINDARRVNELKLAICAEEWRRGLANSGRNHAHSGKQRKGEETLHRGSDCTRDLAAMITQRGCEIAILAISEQARRKQAEKVILQGLVFGLLITAAIALIVLVSGLLEVDEEREKSPVITKVAILSRDGSHAGVFLELHHNLDDMEGVRSDVAMFIQRNFPHVVHDKQMWNGLMTEAKKALKALKDHADDGNNIAGEDPRQIALVFAEQPPAQAQHAHQPPHLHGHAPPSAASTRRAPEGKLTPPHSDGDGAVRDGVGRRGFWSLLGFAPAAAA